MKQFRCSYRAVVVVVWILCGNHGISRAQTNDEVTLERLLPIHLGSAQEYSIKVAGQETLLRENPITNWVNARRAGGQLGHVFLWMDGDQPACMGAIFSFPWGGDVNNRRVVHEMHALSETQLNVERNGGEAKWNPKAGLKRQPIPNCKEPANTLGIFKIRMRQVSRRFSGHCIDQKQQRWELRMLPSPMIVYPLEKTADQHGFGAVFGMMGDVGSDLESGIVLEAVTVDNSTTWRFAPIRMTDMETHLEYERQPIWSSVRTETDTSFYDSDHIYFRFQDQTIPLE